MYYLRETVDFWGGGGDHDFGSDNNGWATKIKSLFLGGQANVYSYVGKLPVHPLS